MHPNPFLSRFCCTSFTTFYLLICFFQTKKEEGGKDKASIEDSAFEALEKDFQDVRIFCLILNLGIKVISPYLTNGNLYKW